MPMVAQAGLAKLSDKHQDVYSSKSEVTLWSDKDNGVPPLHALIEPLYPLMATLAPCPKHCLCSQQARDQHMF